MKEGFVRFKVSAQRVSESTTRNLSNQQPGIGSAARGGRAARGGGGGRERSETMLEMEEEVEEIKDSSKRDW